MQTQAIQAALAQLGYNLGPAGTDGVWGRATIAAFKLFQRARGLPDTGIPDSKALEALFGRRTVAIQPEPVWYAEAERLKGLHEKSGAGSNPTILAWAKALGGWVAKVYTDDATPWCGLFIGHCVSATLPAELLPGNPLSALAWLTFGTKLVDPAIGAVCVFHRAGGGHVGLYAGEDAEAIHVLGGNQSDAVTITRVLKSRLAGMRWPSTAPAPVGGKVTVSAAGALSRNEA